MSYAKVGLDGLAVPAKIQYMRRLGVAINGNPNFPTPNPTAAEVTEGADNLETAYNAAQAARLASKTKTALQDEANVIADALVNQLASYVDNASAGDAEKIESAGFSVRSTPRPVGNLPAPTDLQVVAGDHTGSADLSWQSPRGSRAFLIERATDAPSLSWGIVGTCTRGKTSLNSMTSGTKYWFRVAAIGSAGQSPWSDPVPLFAP